MTRPPRPGTPQSWDPKAPALSPRKRWRLASGFSIPPKDPSFRLAVRPQDVEPAAHVAHIDVALVDLGAPGRRPLGDVLGHAPRGRRVGVVDDLQAGVVGAEVHAAA